MRAKYCENHLHAHRCFTSKEDYDIYVYDYHNGDFEMVTLRLHMKNLQRDQMLHNPAKTTFVSISLKMKAPSYLLMDKMCLCRIPAMSFLRWIV
eukprot:2693997-Pleurochrysis_carterae.AAC.1